MPASPAHHLLERSFVNRSFPDRLFPAALGIAFLVALMARGTLFSTFSIPSGSMRPALEVGDHILVTPYRHGWDASSPRRGDVIVFRSPHDPSHFYTKRVVALPGDVFEIRGGLARINGVTLSEPYLKETGSVGDRGAEIIPVQRYFVMGDRRSDSFDSRAWGTVPESLIIGKAQIIFWSAEDGNHAPSASASTRRDGPMPRGSSIRWSRLFTRIR